MLSEQILNGTSAQLRYIVPFTSVHAGKYRTENKLKIQTIHKLNNNPEKANNTKHSKTKLVSFTQLFIVLQHSARKEDGLILQRSRAYTGLIIGLN